MKPKAKVIAGGAAGATVVVLVYVASLFGIDVPENVGYSATVLISFGAAYLKR